MSDQLICGRWVSKECTRRGWLGTIDWVALACEVSGDESTSAKIALGPSSRDKLLVSASRGLCVVSARLVSRPNTFEIDLVMDWNAESLRLSFRLARVCSAGRSYGVAWRFDDAALVLPIASVSAWFRD